MIGCKRAVVVAQEVAHRTTDQEVPGSDPTGRWAFFLSLFSFLSFNQVPCGGATLLVFQLSKKIHS